MRVASGSSFPCSKFHVVVGVNECLYICIYHPILCVFLCLSPVVIWIKDWLFDDGLVLPDLYFTLKIAVSVSITISYLGL